MYYFFIIIAVVILDQIIKNLTVNSMMLYESIPVIQDVFHITYIHNTGAAFSIMAGQISLLILVPLIMIIAALVFMVVMRKKGRPLMMTSVALIAGGGIGNLIDRIALGYVVDYLDFRVFPIFNLADIAVCVGCGLLVVYVLFFDGKQKNE
jgi:signal peptidase II